jgi:ribokinase
MAIDLQVVGLGMCTLDVLLRTKDMPTWERGVRLSGFQLDGGGPVGTAMVTAARLGAKTGFIGTAGNDEAARLKMRSMTDAGIDLSRMIISQEPDDQVVVVFVHAETGERVFAGVSGHERRVLKADELDRDYITSAEYLHLDGFHHEAALQAAKWMQEAGKKVVLDGHKTSGKVGSHTRDLIEYVDILISGSGFAKGLTDISDIREAGKEILKMGPGVFVQTEGEEGSYTITEEESFYTPAFNVQVVDTTGAGDVFHGAYIVGLLHGWNLQQIAQFSTAVSAMECIKLGGRIGIPYYDEVMSFLEERGIHIPN